MVQRVNLDVPSLQSDVQSFLKSNTSGVQLSHTPKDVQEDIIREYMQAKNSDNLQSTGPQGETADYNEFISSGANNVTKSIIDAIDRKGYTSWSRAVKEEVMNFYRNSKISSVIKDMEKVINNNLGSVDIKDQIGSKARGAKEVTIKSIKVLGAILKKIGKVLGLGVLAGIAGLTVGTLKSLRVIGATVALVGPLLVLLGGIGMGASEGPLAGLAIAGIMSVFSVAGYGAKVGCESIADKLGIYMSPM